MVSVRYFGSLWMTFNEELQGQISAGHIYVLYIPPIGSNFLYMRTGPKCRASSSYFFIFFGKFLFIPIFQDNSYFFLFFVNIMYFDTQIFVDHMENKTTAVV